MDDNKSNSRSIVWNSVLWILVFVVGMVIFTFYDLPIAKKVYLFNEAYGKIFEILSICFYDLKLHNSSIQNPFYSTDFQQVNPFF